MDKMNKIKSIEKGTGEGSTYFAVNDNYQYAPFGDKIHSIQEETKITGNGDGFNFTLTVYNGYDINNKLLFTVESNSQLTINYFQE